MSLLREDFILKAKDGRKICFNRPYINDDKQLEFLFCSHFNAIPNTTYVLNERDVTIEIKAKGYQKVVIKLKGHYEAFYHKALKAKEEIMKLIKDFMQSLLSGKEQIFVYETGNRECPYFFTSQSIMNNGEFSIKFEKGLMYYISSSKKNADNAMVFADINDLNKLLSQKFNPIRKEWRVVQDQEVHYEMPFSELLKIA